jgi:hypothetical protein
MAFKIRIRTSPKWRDESQKEKAWKEGRRQQTEINLHFQKHLQITPI